MTLHPTPRMALVLVLVLLTLLPRVGWLPRAEAATLAFAVTSATDAPDATPGDGLCASTAGGACTLRAAVQEANAQPLGSAVHVGLPAGHYLLTLGELDVISSTVIISGAGAATTVVDAESHSRVLRVSAGSTVGLGLLTLTGGATPARSSGGGLYNSGTLSIVNSTISSNTALIGGGLYNNGALAITNSAIRGNTASRGDGGGLYNNNNGILTITNSAIRGNTASGGGGLYNNGTLTITNSAIRGNTASDGGGLYNNGTLVITNSAIRGNTSDGLYNKGILTIANSAIISNTTSFSGGGLASEGGALAITNSVISGNTALEMGGGLFSSSAVAITNSVISSNTSAAGGGLDNGGGALAITNSAIISNTASLFGGGLFNNSLLTLTNSTVSGNAAAQGAGLYASGGCCVFPTAVAIAYSTISNNTATTQGGGLDNASGLALVVVTGPSWRATRRQTVRARRRQKGRATTWIAASPVAWRSPRTSPPRTPCSARWPTTVAPPQPWPCCLVVRLSTTAAPAPLAARPPTSGGSGVPRGQPATSGPSSGRQGALLRT